MPGHAERGAGTLQISTPPSRSISIEPRSSCGSSNATRGAAFSTGTAAPPPAPPRRTEPRTMGPPGTQAAGRPSRNAVIRRSASAGEALDRLAHRDAACAMRPRGEPGRDLLRPPPSRLAKDPADRLADEELPLIEHRIGTREEPIHRRPVRIGRSSASSDERRTQKSSSVAHRSRRASPVGIGDRPCARSRPRRGSRAAPRCATRARGARANGRSAAVSGRGWRGGSTAAVRRSNIGVDHSASTRREELVVIQRHSASSSLHRRTSVGSPSRR